MNRDMRDYMDRHHHEDMRESRNYRDERNPYGSRGGYVTSDRAYHDDYERDERSRGSRHGDYGMRFNGTIDTRYYDDYGYDERRHDGRRDYNDFGGGYLSKKELREWQNKLCEEMDQQECEMFQYAPIIHQAEQMNISFDKYSKEEFYTTVLMMYTDYYKSCGNNVPMYIALAKDFLEDHDARVKYGEKLACYYDCIAK